MAVAKALGASRIIAVDINPARLEFAKRYAATDGYTPPKVNEGETSKTKLGEDEKRFLIEVRKQGN